MPVDRHVLVATFADEHSVRAAAEDVRAHGFGIEDVYAPYPLHGIDAVMGLRRSRLPLVTLAGGTIGLVSALGFQFWSAVLDWPLNVGGKPANSTLAFVPITFELTVLCAGLATAGAFLARCGLLPGAHPSLRARGSTEDVFVLVVNGRGATGDVKQARQILINRGAREVAIEEVS